MVLQLSFIFLAILLLTVITFFMIMRRFKARERAYKKVLDFNQRQLDLQVSRINILTKALPNLQSVIHNPDLQDTWKTLCLDEARALIWADGACYWKFRDRGQNLEFDVAKGLNPSEAPDETVQRAMNLRIPVNTPNSLAIPLIVGADIRGVFWFTRVGTEPFSLRDVDLVNVFIGQVSLSLTNKDFTDNQETYHMELVQSLADVLDSRDSSVQGSTRSARGLARQIAVDLDMPKQFIYYLEFASLLHDIGKIVIDDHLLKKPGRLTAQEFATIKKHPELGYKIIAPVTLLAPVAPMILYHQEWFNGKGYPEGLKGEEIPLGARIVSVIDAWLAMTSLHPWRKPMSIKEALKELKKGSATQFDPNVVESFVSIIENQQIHA